MNEKYKLNKEWLDLLLEHKNNANVTFNLSNNDIRILLTYIEVLQQENEQLKNRIDKAIEYIEETTKRNDELNCTKLLAVNQVEQLLEILKGKSE